MYTPRIQNMSIDELISEAELTNNELALMIKEKIETDEPECDCDDEYELGRDEGEDSGKSDEKEFAGAIIDDLLEIIKTHLCESDLNQSEKNSIALGKDY